MKMPTPVSKLSIIYSLKKYREVVLKEEKEDYAAMQIFLSVIYRYAGLHSYPKKSLKKYKDDLIGRQQALNPINPQTAKVQSYLMKKVINIIISFSYCPAFYASKKTESIFVRLFTQRSSIDIFWTHFNTIQGNFAAICFDSMRKSYMNYYNNGRGNSQKVYPFQK